LDKQAGKSGKKGGDLSHVVKRLAEGEAGGRRVYSTDFPKKDNWGGVDYQAALFYKLVSVNRADVNGALFGKQHPLSELQRRMWLAINRKTWKLASSRVTRRSKEDTISNSNNPPAATDTALTEPAPIINKHRGLARVIWENIPLELEEDGARSVTTIKGICDLSLEDLHQEITTIFKLEALGFRIDDVSYDNKFSTFEEFQDSAAATENRVEMELRTTAPLGGGLGV